MSTRRVPAHRSVLDRRPHLLGLLVTVAVVLGLTALVAPTASAAVSQVGPTDPSTRFPTYYSDASGLSLAQCLDGLPTCLTNRAQLTPPGGEDFYFDAQASVGPVTVENSLEGAYLTGQEVTFMRTGVFAQKGGLAPGATYTITDPYGPQTCTADPTGVIKKNGCRLETVPTAQDFTSALGGRIGPFLTWDTYGAATGAPPSGFIGDGITPHKVVGSPIGFNKVRVEGPGINTSGVDTCPTVDGPISECDETDMFTVMGKLQPGAVAAVAPAGPLSFGASTPGMPTTRHLTYTNTGSTPVTVSGVALSGANPMSYSTTDTCSGAAAPSLAPGQSCGVDVTFTAQAAATSTATLTISDSTVGSSRTVPLSGYGASGDTTPPTVTARTPDAGVYAVATGTTPVSTTFSEPVQGVSSSSYTLSSPGGVAVPATVSRGMGNTWTLTPSQPLVADTRYSVNLTGGSMGIRDMAGNPLAARTWAFTTGPAPTIAAANPAANATAVPTNGTVALTFNEPVIAVDTSTFTITNVASNITLPATVTKGGGATASATWSIRTSQTLASGARYRVAVVGGPNAVRDAANNPLASASWTFTTR